MSEGRYVVHNGGSICRYELYEHDLSAYGVPSGAVAFNVDWVPGENRAWLLRVLSRKFEQVAKAAHEAGARQVRRDIRKALGLTRR